MSCELTESLRNDVKDFLRKKRSAASSNLDHPWYAESIRYVSRDASCPASFGDFANFAHHAARFSSSAFNNKSIGFLLDPRKPNKTIYSEEETVFCWVRDFLGYRDATQGINTPLANEFRKRAVAEILNESLDKWLPVRWLV